MSLVPATFVSIATDGIAVNAFDCIQWLEDSDVPLADKLRSQGLIR